MMTKEMRAFQKISEHESAAVDGEREAGKIRDLAEGADRGRDHILDQGRDDIAEGGAYDHADGQVDDVAAKDELLEAFHGFYHMRFPSFVQARWYNRHMDTKLWHLIARSGFGLLKKAPSARADAAGALGDE